MSSHGIRFSPAQERAMQQGRMVLAGAGSGKTTILTEKYLRLLDEEGLAPREIIAMTFTRKAASNLLTRIQLAMLQRERAAEDEPRALFWRQQREAMPWARIGTIDSICTSLIRAFPHAAGVDPDFSVETNAGPTQGLDIATYLRRQSHRKDATLARLLEVLDTLEAVEELLGRIVGDLPLQRALRSAARDPEGAADYLDQGLFRLLHAHGLPQAEHPPADRVDHHPYVDLLLQAWSLAEPLLRGLREPKLTLTFEDLEFHALRLLENDTPASRTLRKNIRAVLVDEFQDTSRRQWRLIKALARDPAGRPADGKLYLVGDEKQSIYGFRDADVTVVREAEGALKQSLGVPANQWHVPLGDNYRSRREVLAPLNELFERLFDKGEDSRLPFEAQPQALEAKRTEDDQQLDGPGVQLALGAMEHREQMWGYLADRLEGLCSEERSAKGKQTYRYSDVGILLRTRTILPELERALQARGLPYTIVGGQGFLAKQEVLDLLHFLAALADPRDHIALIGVWRSPLYSLPDTVISALFWDRNPPEQTWRKWQRKGFDSDPAGRLLTGEERDRVTAVMTEWWELTAIAPATPPVELLYRALTRYGALAAYGYGTHGPQRTANIYQFLDLVRELSGNGCSLRGLLQQLKELQDAPDQQRDQEADLAGGEGITIMTIHKAKGLQFPFVVLPDLASMPRNSGIAGLNQGALLLEEAPYKPLAAPWLGSFAQGALPDREHLHGWMHKRFAPAERDAELLRLLYVAMTRAQHQLLMLAPVKFKEHDSPQIHEKSSLAKLVDVLALKLNREGFQCEAPIEGLAIEWVGAEKLQVQRPAAAVYQPLPAKVGSGDTPEVRLRHQQPGERLKLGFTSFAHYLAHPSQQALEALLLGGEMEWEGGEGEEAHPPEETPLAVGASAGKSIGELVHRLLQHHGPAATWDDVAQEVQREFMRGPGGREEARRASERVRELLRGAATLALPPWDVRAEVEWPVSLALGPLLLRGRVDAFWERDGVLHVLDYKTDSLSGVSAESVVSSRGYGHQVLLYAYALSLIRGVEDVQAHLAFLQKPETITLQLSGEKVAWFKAQAQELVERVAGTGITTEGGGL